jgi:hypothetical protein
MKTRINGVRRVVEPAIPFPKARTWPPPQDQGSDAWWAWVRDYYASDEWKARVEFRLAHSSRCEWCNQREAVSVHHLNYDRLGQERMCDLVTRCSLCHQSYHKYARL